MIRENIFYNRYIVYFFMCFLQLLKLIDFKFMDFMLHGFGSILLK